MQSSVKRIEKSGNIFSLTPKGWRKEIDYPVKPVIYCNLAQDKRGYRPMCTVTYAYTLKDVLSTETRDKKGQLERALNRNHEIWTQIMRVPTFDNEDKARRWIDKILDKFNRRDKIQAIADKIHPDTFVNTKEDIIGWWNLPARDFEDLNDILKIDDSTLV